MAVQSFSIGHAQYSHDIFWYRNLFYNSHFAIIESSIMC
jgi:hypothetical protein